MSNVSLEIAEIKSLVKEVIIKVDNFTNIQNEVSALKTEVADLKKRQGNRWYAPVLVGGFISIVAPIITVLVISYLQHAGK